MPKEEYECPVCGYDFDEEGRFWVCRHCGLVQSKPKDYPSIIHHIRHFNPSSRDDLDVRPKIPKIQNW